MKFIIYFFASLFKSLCSGIGMKGGLQCNVAMAETRTIPTFSLSAFGSAAVEGK
jgi:hypothetical protein